MQSRAHQEDGFGLVELLIAMTVMSIGIFALVAGFSSGFGAINRASKTTTAGTLADQKMEELRRAGYAAVVLGTTDDPETGLDGRSYLVRSVVTPTCVLPGQTYNAGPPESCDYVSPASGVASRPVKLVTVTVFAGSADTDPVLITESSTFDKSTG